MNRRHPRPAAFWSRLILCLLLLTLSFACAGKGKAPETVLGPDGQPMPAESAEASGDEPAPSDGEALEPDVLLDDSQIAAVQGWSAEQKQALENVPPGAMDARSKENEAFYRFFYYFTARDEDGRPIKGRRAMESWLRRAQVYLPYIRHILREKNLPEELAYLPFVESGFNNWVYSHAGAGGMWQFMPATGRGFGMRIDWWTDDRRNPYKATVAAAQYLSDLHAMFGDWCLALAAYNAGEGKISRCMQATGCDNFFDLAKQSADLKTETKDYVPKFLAFVRIMRNLEVLGFEPVRLDAAPGFVRFEVPPGTDLGALAQAADMSFAEFNNYNPAFRRRVSPVDRAMPVWLPESLAAEAKAHLASPGAAKAVGWYWHNAAKRDTWANLAQRSGVPADILLAANGGASIHPGMRLRIPNDGGVAIQPLPEPKPQKGVFAQKGRKGGGAQTAQKGSAAVARPATYTAQKGDTLFSLAKRFDVSLDDLRAANGLSKGDVLGVGQALTIPGGKAAPAPAQPAKAEQKAAPAGQKPQGAPKTAAKAEDKAPVPAPQGKAVTHAVKPGETLYSIARQYKVSLDKLLAWNNLAPGAVIKPGGILKIFRD